MVINILDNINWPSFKLSMSCDFAGIRTMGSIEVLENCTKVFQVMGLQCFSLNSFNIERKSESVSAFKKIYVIGIFALCLVMIGCWIQMSFDHNNLLNSVLNVTMALLLILLFSTSLFVSYWKHLVFVDFFRNSQTISALTKLEFNSDINFDKLNRVMNKMMWKFIFNILSLKLIYVILIYYNENYYLNLVLISLFPSLIMKMAVLRFGFYVCIINFHLKSLKKIMCQQFSNSKPQKFKKNQIIRMKSKILKLRKIYSLIETMAKNVNDSLGLTIFFFLCLSISAVVRYGYRAIVIAAKSLPVEKYESEIFEISH